jgi:hypothetical protein
LSPSALAHRQHGPQQHRRRHAHTCARGHSAGHKTKMISSAMVIASHISSMCVSGCLEWVSDPDLARRHEGGLARFEPGQIHAYRFLTAAIYGEPKPPRKKTRPELICINRLITPIFRILSKRGHRPFFVD